MLTFCYKRYKRNVLFINSLTVLKPFFQVVKVSLCINRGIFFLAVPLPHGQCIHFHILNIVVIRSLHLLHLVMSYQLFDWLCAYGIFHIGGPFGW